MSSYFENDVVTIWLTGSDEDRDLELTRDFAFVEPTGRWDAPAGSVVNGASIPSGLRSIIGSPFVGNYRRAAVIHDVYYRNHQAWFESEGAGLNKESLDDAIEKRFGPNL